MRERAALVGGTVTVEASPGAGTTVYVRLPVGGTPDDPASEAPGKRPGERPGAERAEARLVAEHHATASPAR